MNTRKIVKVDEEELRQLMANDKQEYLTDEIITPAAIASEMPVNSSSIPAPVQEAPKVDNPVSETVPVAVSETVISPTPESDSTNKNKKRKPQKADFTELFLKDRIVKNKKQIYISVETYDVIRSYLKYIGDVSFIAYVDNILVQHIEEHKDEIGELFDKKVKPF